MLLMEWGNVEALSENEIELIPILTNLFLAHSPFSIYVCAIVTPISNHMWNILATYVCYSLAYIWEEIGNHAEHGCSEIFNFTVKFLFIF